jgi:CheY-like chemotaxis protein
MSTILLVDDEVEVLDVYSEILEMMGHDVIRAHDGAQALELARQRRPDLVVTDWMMPRMNGVELCGALTGAREFQGLPIIMQSASGNPHVAGVLAFLPKSGELEQFEKVVTRTLAAAAPRAACCEAEGTQASLHPRCRACDRFKSRSSTPQFRIRPRSRGRRRAHVHQQLSR